MNKFLHIAICFKCTFDSVSECRFARHFEATAFAMQNFLLHYVFINIHEGKRYNIVVVATKQSGYR